MIVFVLMALMISCTVGANLLMKIGADLPAGQQSIFGVMSFTGLFGIMLFGVALLFYTQVLRMLPLNVAQSFAAAQFVAVIVASATILGEPIGAMRWAGIALITIGIVFVARSGAVN